MRVSIALSMIGLCWPATAAQARDPQRLGPSGPWNVHYADDSCRLGRSFGQGDQRVTLIFDQFAPGDYLRTKLVGARLHPRGFAPYVGKLRFGPNEAESDITAVSGLVGQQRAIFVEGSQRLSPLTAAEKEAAAEAARRGIPFEAPPVGPAREAAVTFFELKDILR